MKFAKYSLIAVSLLFLWPTLTGAQSEQPEEIFKAQVIEILQQEEKPSDTGAIIQQNLKLRGLSGRWQDQEFEFNGISEVQVLTSQVYKVGDKVIVNYSQDVEGQDNFYILDYDRSQSLWWLAIIFVLSVLVIGRWQGFRSLLALVISFFVILKFIVPQILAGGNPVLISVIGGIIILVLAIYLTQGINQKSHLANASLIIALLFTALLSWLFTYAARLSGYAGEETIFLMNLAPNGLNLSGLLLAGIIIGTLGVLDDVIVSQISTIEELKKANPGLSKREIYASSLKVGIDHITSIINTLFFAYAGAALPLLILFTQSDALGLNFSAAVNNEIIATEIVRTLVGSIGIIFSIPLANYLASYYLKVKRH